MIGAFSVDRECELKAADESKAVVRYSRHPLDTGELRKLLPDLLEALGGDVVAA